MTNAVVLNGSIIAGPVGTSDCGFPSTIANLVFGGRQLPFQVSISSAKVIASPLAFVAIQGIGTGGPVTQAVFLYLRSNAPMQIRITQASAPDVVSIIFVDGTNGIPLLIKFPDINYLKLLEAMGTGTIEYMAVGNQ